MPHGTAPAHPPTHPHAALQVARGKGTIEVTPEWVTYNRRVTPGFRKLEAPLDLKLGATYEGALLPYITAQHSTA